MCISILILSSFSRTAMAQVSPAVVKGIVYDERETTLPFASVSLLDSLSEGKALKGVLSDLNGGFSLSIIPGRYKLQVTMVGYKTYNREIVIEKDTDLGKINLLPDAKMLGEVKITANKPMITRKADRYVLNVGGSILASGRGTFELLNYAPGVMTMGNAVSINGNTATRIMVNGRLLRLSPAQVQNYLNNLRSEDVESIEVIPTPGAEYEAEGAGGLVNVVLKNKRIGGFDGSISFETLAPVAPSYTPAIQLNYGYKGLQLYGSYNYTQRKAKGKVEDFRVQKDLTYQTNLDMASTTRANSFRTGLAYDITKNHYIGIELNGNLSKWNSSSLSRAVLNDPSAGKFNLITGDFLSRTNDKVYTTSFNYDWKIDTLGSFLGLVADYTNSNKSSSGDFHSSYFNQNNTPLFDSVYRNNVPAKVENYNVAANYIKSFRDKTQLKIGTKYTQTTTASDVSYDYYKNDQYISDPQRSNAFRYKEKIAALYAQYSFVLLKTSVQLGLRGEHTATEGYSISTNQKNNRDYFNLFPSVFLSRKLNDKNTLSASYARRLSRPTFNSLNPFEWRIDDYTYISGNPDLKPQYSNAFNLSYLFMAKYDLSLFASQTHGVFAQYLINNGPTSLTANYSWRNLSSQNFFGASLSIPVKATKWWDMNNSIMVYNNLIKFDSGRSERTVFVGKTIQSILLHQNLRWETSAMYQSRYNISSQIMAPVYYIDMGLSNSFFDKKLLARVLVTDIFNTKRDDYEVATGDLTLKEKQKYVTRKFSLRLTYNFSFGKKVKVKKIAGGNAEEKNRM